MNPKSSVPEMANSVFAINLNTYTVKAVDNRLTSLEQGRKNNKAGYQKAKKILVADDDAATIDVVTLMLETAGYKVYASANTQTFADVNTVCPDLILLDVLMSGVSGHDICKKLKKQKSTKHIPIIIISANIHVNEIALHACADDFINKPFEMDRLLQKVARYV